MRVKILKKVWELVWEKVDRRKDGWGRTDGPTVPGKKISIDPRASGETELEVYIHEFLHAADWWKDEYWVEHTARDIARILTRLGYRKNGGSDAG